MKFEIKKEVEKVKFVLEKRQIPNVVAQVAMCLDVSGSTQDLYGKGLMQNAFQRILPIGINFDDNQEVDVFTFNGGNNNQHLSETAKESNYETFIKKFILDDHRVSKWGGTDYRPVIETSLEEFGFYEEKKTPVYIEQKVGGFLGFGGSVQRVLSHHTTQKALRPVSASGYPIINFIFTDGDNSDQSASEGILRECESHRVNVFYQFVGVGQDTTFPFLKRISNLNNVGFINVKNLATIDDDIYEQLLPEKLVKWVKNKN